MHISTSMKQEFLIQKSQILDKTSLLRNTQSDNKDYIAYAEVNQINKPCKRMPQNRSFKVLKITFLIAFVLSGILY